MADAPADLIAPRLVLAIVQLDESDTEPAFVNELAGEGGLRVGVGGESQSGGGERDERGDHSHGAILR